MDLNDEYLRMILALPDEFFEGWEWQAGDRAVNISNNRMIMILWATEPNIWKKERYACYYNYHPSFSNEMGSKITLSEIRPIPSQEQLQDIILKKFHENGLDITDREGLYIFWRLQDWLHGQDFKEMAYLRFECIWLKFLMYLNGKTWNGESWV